MDFISKKRYQLLDIFCNMKTAKKLWKGKYYVRQQKMFVEITKHYAVVCKLKGLLVYKAYHDISNRNMETMTKISG